MAKMLTALGVGILFGLGLSISGMTQPSKVIGFLDLFGNWDPSLAFVMAGAIGVHLLGYGWIKRRQSPLLADTFLVPSKTQIDRNLVIGSILFGMGWGLAGYCPGPAIVSLVSMQIEVFMFIGAMSVGMLAHHKFLGF